MCECVPVSCCDTSEPYLCEKEGADLNVQHSAFYSGGCGTLIPQTIKKKYIDPTTYIILFIIIVEVRYSLYIIVVQ